MKNTKSLFINLAILTIAAFLNTTTLSYAASHAATASGTTASALPLVSAEVRKVDIENKKISLKHGEIKNLDMPGMSMVFQVKDAAMLANIKAGDKVMFTADKLDGAYTVMSIEKAK
jgi:Cu(I)/Ag(I) efflux system periplasmic protein CusF